MLDVVVRGGTLVDGTGAHGRPADLGIRDGRVVAVGTVEDDGATTIDATGLVVSPGFVDVHTHYDAQLMWDPAATPSSLHGVTTVIGGNCGFTVAPLAPDDDGYLARMMARVEGMPLAALEAGLDWKWGSFGEWLDRLDGRLAVNAGFLAGHSAIRHSVMGAAAPFEAATPAQLDEMSRVLHQALDAGALGFSTSTAPTHNDDVGNPVPSRGAAVDELVHLATVTGKHPGTVLELILAGCVTEFSPDEIALMTQMSLGARRPLNWNVLGVSSMRLERARHQLSASDAALAAGATVVALTLPYLQRLRLSLHTGFVFDALPGWAPVMGLPIPERVAALRDPVVRERLRQGAASDAAGRLRSLMAWPRLEIEEVFDPENLPLVGRSIGAIAAERGQDPFDVLLDVVLVDGLRTGLVAPPDDDDDESWRLRAEAWRDPRTVLGGSDAGAHLDMMCGAVIGTSLLGAAVRERELLTVEEAVRQLTDVPARMLGLRDRGRLVEGACADLTIFDAETIGAGPTWTRADLPGGATRLWSDPIGVEHVVVNGVPIVRDRALTGDQPGTLLRSGRNTETVLLPFRA